MTFVCLYTVRNKGNALLHCHHKTATYLGGDDSYRNLILIDVDVHILVHVTKENTIGKYLSSLQLDQKQLKKANKLRAILCLNEISK